LLLSLLPIFYRLKKFLLLAAFLPAGLYAKAQVAFSIATDVSLLRNFTKGQSFFAFGQTVVANFHITPKESAYASISYYTNGKNKNTLTATSKDLTALPLSLNYTSFSKLRFRQFSIGWKHYLKGGYAEASSPGLYGLAGFGLLTARAENSYRNTLNTARYTPVQQALAGTATIKRLTLDLGLGGEAQIAEGFFFYAELKTWIQASGYPSPHLYNNHLPKAYMLNGGLRIMIE
jgi:hypothetical protein